MKNIAMASTMTSYCDVIKMDTFRGKNVEISAFRCATRETLNYIWFTPSYVPFTLYKQLLQGACALSIEKKV